LKDPDKWPKQAWGGLRIQEGEQLDVVGLVKRTAGGKQSYPSVARVAADAWIRGLLAAGKEAELNRLREECQKLSQNGIHRLITSAEGYPQYASFPFEGTVVYRSRHRDLRDEAKLQPEDLQPLLSRLNDLIIACGEPSAYLAVLVADGDRMGRALAQIASAQDHRVFSEQLARFADEARRVVSDHFGVLVYAGGDDLLAFLPVDRALECARRLHEVFADLMEPCSEKTGWPLTLSVGLAIAHFMEDLADLLQYGRAAEKHAKGRRDERNGLAVHVIKRGGGPVAIRSRWTDDPDPVARLTQLAELQDSQAIPGRVAYDLHRVADIYENWSDPSQVAAAIPRDALGIIRAKQPRASGGLEYVREALARVSEAQSLRRLADELLVTRPIAAAMRQAAGRKEVAS
jgi:CRISPR-associated protein Cmr2